MKVHRALRWWLFQIDNNLNSLKALHFIFHSDTTQTTKTLRSTMIRRRSISKILNNVAMLLWQTSLFYALYGLVWAVHSTVNVKKWGGSKKWCLDINGSIWMTARSQNNAPYLDALWVIMETIVSVTLMQHLAIECILYQSWMLQDKTKMQDYQIKSGVHKLSTWNHV